MQGPTLIHFTDAPGGFGSILIGRTFEAHIVVRGVDGNPVNLSGYNVASSARKSSDDAAPAWEFVASLIDIEEGGITYPAAAIRLFLGATAATTLVRGMYWYDATLTSKTDAEIVVEPVAGHAQVEGTATH